MQAAGARARHRLDEELTALQFDEGLGQRQAQLSRVGALRRLPGALPTGCKRRARPRPASCRRRRRSTDSMSPPARSSNSSITMPPPAGVERQRVASARRRQIRRRRRPSLRTARGARAEVDASRPWPGRARRWRSMLCGDDGIEDSGPPRPGWFLAGPDPRQLQHVADEIALDAPRRGRSLRGSRLSARRSACSSDLQRTGPGCMIAASGALSSRLMVAMKAALARRRLGRRPCARALRAAARCASSRLCAAGPARPRPPRTAARSVQ